MERNSFSSQLSLSSSNLSSPIANSTQIPGIKQKFPWGGFHTPVKINDSSLHSKSLNNSFQKASVSNSVQKLDPRVYTDVQSQGLTSRIVKYYENSMKLNRSVSCNNLYNKPGQFPIVHLKKNEIPYKLSRNKNNVSMVRIAPPDKSVFQANSRSSILRSGSVVPTVSLGLKPTNQDISRENRPILHPATENEAPTRSVLEALKEISRKRINSDDLESNDTIKKYCKESTYETVAATNSTLPLANFTTSKLNNFYGKSGVAVKRNRDLTSPSVSPTAKIPNTKQTFNCISKPRKIHNEFTSSISSSLSLLTPKRKYSENENSSSKSSPNTQEKSPSVYQPRQKQRVDLNLDQIDNEKDPIIEKAFSTTVKTSISAIPGRDINTKEMVKPLRTCSEPIIKKIDSKDDKPKLTLFNKNYGIEDGNNIKTIPSEDLDDEDEEPKISFVKPKEDQSINGICFTKNALIEKTQKNKLALMLSGLRGELNEDQDEVDGKNDSKSKFINSAEDTSGLGNIPLNQQKANGSTSSPILKSLDQLEPDKLQKKANPNNNSENKKENESSSSEIKQNTFKPVSNAFTFGKITSESTNKNSSVVNLTATNAAASSSNCETPLSNKITETTADSIEQATGKSQTEPPTSLSSALLTSTKNNGFQLCGSPVTNNSLNVEKTNSVQNPGFFSGLNQSNAPTPTIMNSTTSSSKNIQEKKIEGNEPSGTNETFVFGQPNFTFNNNTKNNTVHTTNIPQIGGFSFGGNVLNSSDKVGKSFNLSDPTPSSITTTVSGTKTQEMIKDANIDQSTGSAGNSLFQNKPSTFSFGSTKPEQLLNKTSSISSETIQTTSTFSFSQSNNKPLENGANGSFNFGTVPTSSSNSNQITEKLSNNNTIPQSHSSTFVLPKSPQSSNLFATQNQASSNNANSGFQFKTTTGIPQPNTQFTFTAKSEQNDATSIFKTALTSNSLTSSQPTKTFSFGGNSGITATTNLFASTSTNSLDKPDQNKTTSIFGSPSVVDKKSTVMNSNQPTLNSPSSTFNFTSSDSKASTNLSSQPAFSFGQNNNSSNVFGGKNDVKQSSFVGSTSGSNIFGSCVSSANNVFGNKSQPNAGNAFSSSSNSLSNELNNAGNTFGGASNKFSFGQKLTETNSTITNNKNAGGFSFGGSNNISNVFSFGSNSAGGINPQQSANKATTFNFTANTTGTNTNALSTTNTNNLSQTQNNMFNSGERPIRKATRRLNK